MIMEQKRYKISRYFKESSAERHRTGVGIGLFVYIIILSFIICYFTLYVSPLFNLPGIDIEVLFTVGRGWLNGKMPYRDLYDHKGFILHFFYMLSALIKSDGYIGIFIIHTILTSINLFGIYKLITLFCKDNRYCIATMTISGLLMNIHLLGGNPLQAETIAIGCYCYALYIMIKQLRDNIIITDKQWYIIGITSSLLLWSKITLTGFYIGYIIPYFIICVKQKKVGTFIKNIIFIILGILTITIPFFIYMFIQGYFVDFLNVYFYDNLFKYKTNDYKIIGSYGRAILDFLKYANISLFVIILFFIKIKNRKKEKIQLFKITEYKASIVFSFISLFLITFIEREGWGYYYTVFIVYTSLSIYLLLRRMGKNGYFKGIFVVQSPFKSVKEQIILAILPIIFIFYFITMGNMVYVRRYVTRTEIANTIIKDIEDDWCNDKIPNVMEYDLILGNEYVKWDYIPEMKNFIFLPINTQEAQEERIKAIVNKTPDYILSCKPIDIQGYQIIKEYNIGYQRDNRIDILIHREDADTIYLYRKVGVKDYGFYFNL